MRLFTINNSFFKLNARISFACFLFFISLAIKNESLATPANTAPTATPENSKKEISTEKMIYITTGTGFFINNNTVITNEHVVQDCASIKIRGAINLSDAELIATNKTKDLAMIRTSINSRGIAALRGDVPIQNNEEVNVMGYPLERGMKGTYLIRKATIVNNSDIYKGVERIAFTDAVEHGNSGGPLLDTSGTVIGVIVGKVSFYPHGADEKNTQPTQTSSVAITLKDLKSFLNAYGIFFHTDNINYRYSDDYMENKAKDYIVNVQCYKRDE